MREATLAIVLPATRLKTEAQPHVCPEDADTLLLIRMSRSGDMGAFDRLMRTHERMVLMTAARVLNGNMADAQDAAQTVFLRLHRSLGQFRDEGQAASFPAWLYRITMNVCRDMQRKTQRRAEVELAPAMHLEAREAAPGSEVESQMAAIQAGLEQLGEKERAAIVLRDIEGLDTRLVASILGSSEATVRSQISTGRRKIRRFVESYMRRRP